MNTPTVPLHDAITKAAQGDRDAFRALFDASHDKVFRFLLGQLGGRDDALDALQDIFIDLWKVLPRFRYRSDEEFWGFLFTIVRRKVYAYRKHAEHRPTLLQNDELEAAHHEAMGMPPPSTDHTVLMGAMDLVSVLSREVLSLRYWSALSFKEIAIATGTTENAAKVRHHRALKELQTYLPKEYVEQQFI